MSPEPASSGGIGLDPSNFFSSFQCRFTLSWFILPLIVMKSILFVLVVFAVVIAPIYAIKFQSWNHADCTGPPAVEYVLSNSKSACQPSIGAASGAFFRITSDCSRSHTITYDSYTDGDCTQKISDNSFDQFPSWGCYNDYTASGRGFDVSSYKVTCASASTMAYSIALIVLALFGAFFL
jgi:hypothetical protein